MQCIQSDRCCLVADDRACDVGAGPGQCFNLPAVWPGDGAIEMDLLVTIVQIVKDLLGSLNPFRLFRPDYRGSFRKVWRREPFVFLIGYVLGTIGLLVLVALVIFWFLRGTQA